MKNKPTQYEINNLNDKDMVVIIQRSFVYQLLRKLFNTNPDYVTINSYVINGRYYQNKPQQFYAEDCLIVYDYEIMCQHEYNKDVYYTIAKHTMSGGKQYKARKFWVTLYNINIELEDGMIMTIPVQPVELCISKNKQKLQEINKDKLIEQNLKFIKYKGETFRNIVKERKIRQWSCSYCSVCGKPVQFVFHKDVINIINKCECSNTKLDLTEMTYDEFAIWYAGQTDKIIRKQLDKFWFNKE